MASEEDAVATTPSSAKFPHSHSSPGAVDAVSLNESSESKQRSGKLLSVNVIMLDESNITLHVQHKALGQALFDLVCKQLSLLEVDYFGLEYEDSSCNQYWLDLEKPMNRQLDLSLVNCTMRFGVKFYTPDPAQLEEEYTRYMFCLQIKKDLSTGMLQCNDNTAAIMASYIVQADCGDYVPDDYPDHTYLSSNKFVPHQDSEMERRIMENHKKHVGQNPAEADLNLLETARRCELYGIRMHPAKDHEGVPLNLAIAHMGVLVFQNYTKINTFSWAKIRKLSFKRKRFLIKLHPEGYGYYKDTVEFFFEGRNECKNFWKKCVEHHGFFRCSMVKKLPRQKTRVISRGSSFRYSGRTQKQVVDFVRDNYVKRQPFQRSQSFRHPNSANNSIGKVGASKSAQPLLPVGDQTVGTPASQSCGSMVLNDSGSTEALASPTRERAEIHSDDQASGEYKLSPMASPKLNSDQRQNQDERVLPLMNGGVAQTEAGQKEGEVGLPQTEAHPKASTRSCTESPSSRSSLRQDDSSKEHNEADGEDNLSQDSYQLFDVEGGTSPQKRVSNGAKISIMGVPHHRLSNGDPPMSTSQSACHAPYLEAPPNSEHNENEQGKGVNGKGENAASGIDNDIAYVLHKRHFANADPARGVSETPPPLPSPLTHPTNMPSSKSSASGVGSGQKGFKPVKPPRIQVDVDHQKITQSSPTLYARSRLNREDSPLRRNSATSPKSPLPRSLDFVCVHDLPAVFSYSSKDDSITNHFIEKAVEIQAQKRRSDISNASSSSLQSRDSDYLEPLRIVEDGDEDVVMSAVTSKTEACRNGLLRNGTASYYNGSGKMSAAAQQQQQLIDQKADELEWEALAPTFPPPPPPPFHEMDDDDCGYLDTIPGKGSIDVARNQFLKSTIVDVSISERKKVYLEELSDVSNDEIGDNDTTVTVEESSDTGDATVVENYPPPPPRSLIITEQEDNEVEGGGEAKAESYTMFGAEEYYSGEIEDITASVHDDEMANTETDSLPQDPELDDEEVESCPPLEDSLLFPVRTLSRISERSTSEQSESKDSTPTQESKPSDDRHPSACDLPSDYSTSDDNPSDCGGASSNESEGSPSRGREPGTGSGLGLSPVRAIRTTAVFDSHRLYENRYVLPDDGSQLETYYMEIDPVQQEQLEKGVFDRIEYDPIPGDNFEDTSSTDVTLREEISPLDDFLPSPHCLETYTGGLTPRYEGFDVRINVVPSTSPSPIRTPEPRGPDSSPGSTCSSGSRTKRRHRSSIELQVSNGHILENKHASLASPSVEDSGPGTTFVNLYADASNKD